LIKLFIAAYKIDLHAAKTYQLSDYESFNQFFIRQLHQEARPIVSGENELASPADGTISQVGPIEDEKILQAKGHHFKLLDLLGGIKEYEAIFAGGSFMTIYLAPGDYHRVHMPIDGRLLKTIYVPGKLFSVNPYSVATIQNLFCKNERLICLFETKIGLAAVIMVGAMLVAGIETVWGQQETPCQHNEILLKNYETQSIHLKKGSEMGHFKFGSTVIVLFPPRKVELARLKPQQTVKMGTLIGHILSEGS
jgi:phosphatidylserine decarboxylase